MPLSHAHIFVLSADVVAFGLSLTAAKTTPGLLREVLSDLQIRLHTMGVQRHAAQQHPQKAALLQTVRSGAVLTHA